MPITVTRWSAVLAIVLSLTSQGLADAANAQASDKEGAGMTKIHVRFDDQVLTATLDDTPAGRDFAALLPLELTLSDYHGIEKVADLPRKLDTSHAPSSYTPTVGDITLYAPWGNLAIFYKPFRNAPGLVRLGAFDDPIGALIQDQDIKVLFSIVE